MNKLASFPSNMFQFWTAKSTNYPGLFDLVQKSFCVPASSVPVERQYIQSGLVMQPHQLGYVLKCF